MSYDALINRLTQDLKPVRRRRARLDILIVAIICAIELAAFFGLGLARPDMPSMMKQPTVWWRLSSLGLLTIVSGGFAVSSFYPTSSPRRGIRWIVLIIAACLASGLFLGAGVDGMGAVIQRLNWMAGLQCTYKMILLSMPPVIGFGLLMRRGAPTDTRGTALLVGLAAASWGAFVFVFACPSDDPIYIAVWYSAGCGIITGLSRIILPFLVKW